MISFNKTITIVQTFAMNRIRILLLLLIYLDLIAAIRVYGQNANMVKDMKPGSGDGLSQIIGCNDQFLFITIYGTGTSIELWVTDGTEPGTTHVATFTGSADTHVIAASCFMNNILYFM